MRNYHAGHYNLALAQLTELLADRTLDVTIARDARVYIGEIFLVNGNESGAKEAFDAALRLDPDMVLDPFLHPPDVCAQFMVERSLVGQVDTSVQIPAAMPRPASRWLPLGLAQAREHRPSMGTLFGTTQVITCGLSAGLFGWLLFDRRYGTNDEPGIDPSTGWHLWTLETLRGRRNVQLVATAGCYTSYALGVFDAHIAARRQTRRDATTGAAASPNADPVVGLRVSGRF